MNCLRWAFDDMTAQNAYDFYNNYCIEDFFREGDVK